MQSCDAATHSNMTCLQSNGDDKVADSDLCCERVEQEVEAETAKHLQLTRRHKTTGSLAVADCECPATTDNVNSCRDELASCVPVPAHGEVAIDPASSNNLTHVRTLALNDKDVTMAEESPTWVINKQQDLIECDENVSAVHFDINTPIFEPEPSDCIEGLQKVANDMEGETSPCPNVISSADRHSIEPVRVLSFSHIDRSLDETQDPVERVICAAELNEDMSEVLDRDEEETSISKANVDSRQLFCHDCPEVFSALNALTPIENHCKFTLLVADTPVSDYGMSYRQRALRAGNIRLRHRTRKS